MLLRQLIEPFSALWTQRYLLWQFTLRNVELRHKGSHLGLLWSFLNPLLMLALYVLVFGYILGGKFGVLPNETQLDYALGIFLGLTLFHFAAEVIATSPSIIVGNPNFVKKVVFPLDVLPAASVGAAAIHLVISLVLVVGSIIILGPTSHAGIVWLPVIVLPVVLLMLGVAWLISALGVFIRDTAQFVQFISIALMFASAVFYSTQKIPPAAWHFLRLNPILIAIEQARNACLWDLGVNPHHLGYLYAVSLVTCIAGHGLFQRMKPAFADVL